eukprot:1147287-Pelagomonas_calceolata.AAC.5
MMHSLLKDAKPLQDTQPCNDVQPLNNIQPFNDAQPLNDPQPPPLTHTPKADAFIIQGSAWQSLTEFSSSHTTRTKDGTHQGQQRLQ